MLFSMTGFGRAHDAEGELSVEIRSVNHKGLDVRTVLPSRLNGLDVEVVRLCRQRLGRGRIEVRIEMARASMSEVGVGREAVARIYEDLVACRESLGMEEAVTLHHVLRCPAVWTSRDVKFDLESMWLRLEPVVLEAMQSFNTSRSREGSTLRSLLLAELDVVRQTLERAAEVAPLRVVQFRERLLEHMQRLMSDLGERVDMQRIVTEVGLYADRVDVREELDRAASHVDELRRLLDVEREASDRVGKRIDFFLQELTREANTLAAKSRESTLTRLAIDMKSSIETMREQAANIQ